MPDELNFNVPIRLNSFGETIRRIEAERIAEAEKAVANGWTEQDHPAKCCPTAKTTQPKRQPRPTAEVQRLLDRANIKLTEWQSTVTRLQAELDRTDANRPKFDHGMMQLSLKTRRKGMSREMRTWRSLEHAKERADHYQRLTKKYQDQITKRS